MQGKALGSAAGMVIESGMLETSAQNFLEIKVKQS